MRPAHALRKLACWARAEIGVSDQTMVGRRRMPNRNAASSSQAVVKSRHVHEQQRNVNQTIDAIQDSPMPGYCRPHILGSDVSLDHADREIAEQSADSDNKARKNQLLRAEKWK